MAKRLYGVEPIQRFNQKYIVDEETGCWLWQGTISKKGYGTFHVNHKEIKAHRFSYEYFIGPLDTKLMICHNCHNRKCCNPEHLRQDSNYSNMVDMVHEGNQRHQVLSVEEVIEIKKELKHYYRGQIKDLAKIYKVNRSTIEHINKGRTWSHVKID